MKQKKIVVGVVVLVCMLAFTAGAALCSGPMKLTEMTLRHPRRGHQLTFLKGEKEIWITGGKAYYSHFLRWEKSGYEKYTNYPNVEYIDLKTKKVVYTDVAMKTAKKKPKSFYKAVPFVTDGNGHVIYLAAKKILFKLDTRKAKKQPDQALTEIDPGVKGDWREASWGKMKINGKKYIVLVNHKGVSFFDIKQEKFVKLAGMDKKLPDDPEVAEDFGGCVIDEKAFYIFGGVAPDAGGSTHAWKFDPSKPSGSQWSSLPDLPIGTTTSKVASVNKKAYIMGGTTAGTYYNVVLEYDPETNKYTKKADLPFGVFLHGVTVDDRDHLWISYGYTWGTKEENRYGFRMHPPHIVDYDVKHDTTVGDFGERVSVSGEYMNVNITWPDADHVTGASQTIAVNWTASTNSTRGVLYYKKKQDPTFSSLEAAGKEYFVGFDKAKSYVAILTLKPNTTYEYKVVSEGTPKIESAVYTYKTPPASQSAYTFAVYGDAKAQYDINHELNCDILDAFNSTYGHLGWFSMLGDYGAQGGFQEFDSWFSWKYGGRTCTKDLAAQYPMLPVHGNHEVLSRAFYDSTEMPSSAMAGWPAYNNTGYEEYWYSFNYEKVHLAVINTGKYTHLDWYTNAQLNWLKADLAKAKAEKAAGNIDWIMVLGHHAAFTSGDHFEDLADYGMMDPGSYVDVIDNNGAVDVVFLAHDHDYERTKSIRGYRWKDEKFIALPGATVGKNSAI
jgi:hypothetical protein